MEKKKSLKIVGGIIAALVVISIVFLVFNLSKADTVYYGNIVTMDDSNPNAEAVAVKGGKITYVGNAEGSKGDIGSFTKIQNYGENSIYPGFLNGHAHIGLLATLSAGGSLLDSKSKLKPNMETMKQFITDNPGKEVYKGFGWWEFADDLDKPNSEVIDKYCPADAPIVLINGGGHSAILNQKAIEYFDIKNKINVYGTDGIQVDAQGNPTGLLVETPRFDISEMIPVSKDELKEYFAAVQDVYINQGYTTIMEAGIVETDKLPMLSAYQELVAEGKLKIRIRAYVQISETEDNKLEKVDQIAKWSKEINDDYFKVVGVKIFLDGVPEALTSWTSQPYFTLEKGENYTGYKRWTENTKQELIDIIKKSNENGLMVHFHSMGEGATSYALDCFEAAGQGKTDVNYRNGLCHLSMINDKDWQRFVDNKVIAFVAPQWSTYKKGAMENEIKVYGEEGSKQMYKIKSFLDKGITTTFHSDGYNASIPEMIYMAATRFDPKAQWTEDTYRGLEERINHVESLKCMTTTTAYSMKEENNLGCIKVGYLADFAIYDQDFRTKDGSSLEDLDILDAKLLAVICGDRFIYPYSPF